MKRYLFFCLLILMNVACENWQKSKMDPVYNKEIVEKAHLGKLIMEQECSLCHDPKASMVNRIAPPMVAIKRHYIDSNTTKEEFMEALIRWVNDPETETKMPGAHAKFGPMPYMPIPDDAIAQIADYIYDNELECPEGFGSCFQKVHMKGSGMEKCNYVDYPDAEGFYASIGLSYAKEAKSLLGENLAKVIREKGIVEAIDFCHSAAIKLTDSISIMNNAIVKRVSDQTRNPENQANEEELRYILNFKKALASGDDMKPIVHINNGEVNFYYPIITNTLCLQCHGKPDEQILPETLSALKFVYPKDKAMGYGDNEVRGIWSINFDTDN